MPILKRFAQAALINLSLIISVQAAPFQQVCDDEIRTCCLAQEMKNIPPMWVNDKQCPQGTSDDSGCDIQYGCKQKSN